MSVKTHIASSRHASHVHAAGVLFGGRKALLPLHFIIVGGGISGLACGFALTHAGHRCTVLEAADSIRRNSSGMHMPPNLTKLLYQWGLGEQVEKLALATDGMEFVSYTTGGYVGCMRWADELLEAFGADYPVVSHGDLYKIIYDAAVSVGVQIRFGAKVKAVNPRTPSVTLSSGQVMTADFIIGADGHLSMVREVVAKGQSDQSSRRKRETCNFSGTTIYSAQIPSALLRKDPDLHHFLDYPGSTIWMGSNRHAVGYPVSSRNEYTLHLLNMDTTESETFFKVCNKPSEEAGLQRNVRGCEPKLRKLIDLFPSVLCTRDAARRHEREWVHSSGKVILLGEAAHPTMPCIAQGAAMGIEDSVVLGSLLSRLRIRDQIPAFLSAYQNLRQERCLAVQRNERMTCATFWIPDGPEQRSRDEGMAYAATIGQGQFCEGLALQQWEDCKWSYAYDANDEAESWYVEWGVLAERAARTRETGMMPEVAVRVHVEAV